MNSDSGAPPTPREGEVGASLDTQMEGVPWALRCLVTASVLVVAETVPGLCCLLAWGRGLGLLFPFLTDSVCLLTKVYPLPMLLNEAPCDGVCFC